MLEGGSKTRDGREPKKRERVRGSACVVIDEIERERGESWDVSRDLVFCNISGYRLDIDERVAPGRGRESVPLFTPLFPPPLFAPVELSASVFSASV